MRMEGGSRELLFNRDVGILENGARSMSACLKFRQNPYELENRSYISSNYLSIRRE